MADWIYGIAAVLILGGVVAEAVPEGAWRKYIRLFLGVLVILAAAAPVLSLFGISDRAALSYEEGIFSSWVDQIERQGADADWDGEVQKHQEEAFRAPLTALTESFGYRMESYSMEWEGNEPSAISLTVSEIGGEEPPGGEDRQEEGQVEEVRSVEPVGTVGEMESGEDGGEDGGAETAAYYEPSELRGLHDTLASVFSFSAEQVTIYLVREGEG